MAKCSGGRLFCTLQPFEICRYYELKKCRIIFYVKFTLTLLLTSYFFNLKQILCHLT
jgi:hypothetical protein